MAEEVTVKKYKSLDGLIYDSLHNAELADRRWKEANEFNISFEIKKLERNARRDILRKVDRYPRIVNTIDKHDNQYFFCMSEDGMLSAYFDLLNERKKDGYYSEPNKVIIITDEIIKSSNKFAAYGFIMSRDMYEYEEVINTIATVYK